MIQKERESLYLLLISRFEVLALPNQYKMSNARSLTPYDKSMLA